jgi:hypothetical protein
LHPDLVFTKYVLSFTGPGSETHEPVALTGGNTSASIALALGAWTIDAAAYTGTGADEQETAQGSVDVTVLETGPVQAYIILGPIPGTETGMFSYAITLPAGASTATLSLTDAATDTAVPGSPIDLTGAGGSSGTLDLVLGSYLMQIQLTKAGGEITGLAEALHIYAGLTTSVTLDGDDLSAVLLSELAAYLASLPANTAATPYTVILGPSIIIDTADTNANGVWATINSTVQNAGKYVILDISACTAVGNTISGTSDTPTNNDFNIIQSNQYIKGITLPSTLTSIGEAAFQGCTGLTSVTIPDSVTSIMAYAFWECISLTNVTIPGSVTSIMAYAFYECIGLTSVTIGDGVASIGNQAFAYCRGLTSVTIPDSVTTIGWMAFSTCSGLTSVTIPDSVTTIGGTAFGACSSLTAFTVAAGNTAYSAEDGILYNKNKTRVVAVPGTKSGAFNNLPSTLTSIEEGAFYGCSGLTSVTIPDSVTTIGQMAFAECSGLTSVTIPDSVTTISVFAFQNCSDLTSVTIPGSVTSIAVCTFYGCSGLTSVTISGSVTSIGNQAFQSCDGLTSVIFGVGSNITTAWDNGAFSSSTNSSDCSGDSLWAAYTAGSKAGTYTRSGSTWTQES